MMKFGTLRSAAVLAVGSLLLPAAAAHQGGAQPGAAQTGDPLNIPQDLRVIGRGAEPNVARATAIVNDEIITRTDIDHRAALFTASQRVQLPPEEMERLRAQVLRNLIDETLQIQAAAENDIAITPREINGYYERYAKSFGHTPQTFTAYVRSIGSSERSVKRQIQGELSWDQLKRRLMQVSVQDEEVQQILDRLNASRGSSEYRVAEIFLDATPENAAQVRAAASQIVEQVRRGGSFQAFARQYSKASTAATGGDLGWVRAEQLPQELAAVVQSMPVQAISDPVQVPGGYSVIALVDSRQVLVANPRDAVLSLMQMAIELPPGSTEATARQKAEQLAQATQTMGGCGGAAAAATRVGAELVSNDSMKVRDLPAPLQEVLLNMSIGQATRVYGSTEGVRVFILCGRDDPQATPAPTFSSIADQIEEQRMNRQAQRYLRDLRRDAVIEYR
jgi:peptidyl-prolyl cis-trans isomerase SurA